MLEGEILPEKEIPAEEVDLKEKSRFLFKNPHVRFWSDTSVCF